MTDVNQYPAPLGDESIGDTVLRRRRWAASVAKAPFSVAVAFALLYAINRGVHAMTPDGRPGALLGVAFLFFIWPAAALVYPRPYLFGIILFPLLGIVLGITFTGDMGQNSYMFAAMPSCLMGLWGVVASSGVAIHRFLNNW